MQQLDMGTFGLRPEVADTCKYMASMGIYVFRTDILLRLLRGHYPTANDFGSEVIPMAAKDYNVQVFTTS
jgi:glucose-1-phosphate adenylyltransferase